MPRTIGLTGNIACGKTAVGHMLLELGAEKYIDADAVVHQLYQAGQPIAIKVGEVFGAAAFCQSKWLVICTEEQQLSRLMARNAFSEAEARARILAQPSVTSRLPLVDE